MSKTRLIFVGGFLGAGKTTLLYEATRIFMEEGKRVGLVTNDQAPELVDSAILLQTRAEVEEVSGSCFCCNYNGLMSSLQKINLQSGADVIIAEPVGSCTDLSATIMQPFKDLHKQDFLLSPLTVLVDPYRLKEMLAGNTGGLHPSASYILEKQLEESDIIVISKSDLLQEDELRLLIQQVSAYFPDSEVMALSSRTGQGIREWIQKVREHSKIGLRLIQVDYDRYAEGEAVLGWLNASVSMAGNGVDWDRQLTALMNCLGEAFDQENLSVGHVKVILKNGEQSLAGNLTGKSSTLLLRGSAGISDHAELIINARVETLPSRLAEIVQRSMQSAFANSLQYEILAWKCLSPGYPSPTYRYNKVVG